MTEKKETVVTKKIVRELSDPQSHKGIKLWQSFDLQSLPACPLIYEKKAGAKADAAFLKHGSVCLLLENKCYGADLTDRQERLYLNHFLHFYDNCDVSFTEHRLIFLVDKKSRYLYELGERFSESYMLPNASLGDKSHLKDIKQLGVGKRHGNGWVDFNLSAKYKNNKPYHLTVSVKVVGIDVTDFETT